MPLVALAEKLMTWGTVSYAVMKYVCQRTRKPTLKSDQALYCWRGCWRLWWAKKVWDKRRIGVDRYLDMRDRRAAYEGRPRICGDWMIDEQPTSGVCKYIWSVQGGGYSHTNETRTNDEPGQWASLDDERAWTTWRTLVLLPLSLYYYYYFDYFDLF